MKNLLSDNMALRVEFKNDSDKLGNLIEFLAKNNCCVLEVSTTQKTETTERRISFTGKLDVASAEKAIKELGAVKVLVMNSVEDIHYHGKLSVVPKVDVATRMDLAKVYTPYVGDICKIIHADKDKVYDYTIKANTVAVLTDGTAVLGLGDIGPEASLPVMEGKAMLFKKFAGIDSFPIAVTTKEVDEIVKIVKYISPVFGGINLEDIAAPRCFEIEEKLRKEVDIPVFHDDQHGTAIVVAAAIKNALKIVKKDIKDIKIVVNGTGAAGTAIIKMLLAIGAKNIIGFNKTGIVSKNSTRDNSSDNIKWLEENTNPSGLTGTLDDMMAGADVFVGVSVAGALSVDNVKKMARDAIVFALANPVPEIMPDVAAPYVRIMATGRSDFPNQINNILAFPGIFAGALEARASDVTQEMKLAAIHAISSAIDDKDLREDYILPSIFDGDLTMKVRAAVYHSAIKCGVSRLKK